MPGHVGTIRDVETPKAIGALSDSNASRANRSQRFFRARRDEEGARFGQIHSVQRFVYSKGFREFAGAVR